MLKYLLAHMLMSVQFSLSEAMSTYLWEAELCNASYMPVIRAL